VTRASDRARRRDRRRAVRRLGRGDQQDWAILLATSVGYVSVVFAALWPETIFLWLVNSSGAVALFVYLLIAVSELRLRARLEREDPERLRVRTWLYPWLTWIAIAAIVVVIGSIAWVDDVRDQLWWSLGSLAVVLVAAWVRTLQPRPAERRAYGLR
jgi:GABA permease